MILTCLLLVGCAQPVLNAGSPPVQSEESAEAASALASTPVQPAPPPATCAIPCGGECCTEGDVCTAGGCAPAGQCERELGPTFARRENVPFSEMARAVRKAKPGTTITLAPGTYREPLHIVGRGTQDAPVIVAANPPGSVKFTGAGQIELTGEHLIVSGFDFDGGAIPLKTYAILFRNCHHCRLTNCKIRRYEPIEGNDVQWVRFTTGHHNRIDHCEIHDKSDFGEMVRVTNFTEGFDRIDHNYLHDFIRTPPKNGGEAIRLGTNGTRRTETTVDHNLFERIRAESEIISVKSNGNHFTSNTFRDCFAELTIRQGEDNVVTGNVFTASSRHPGGGVRTYGKRNRIQDNDFEGLDSGIRLGAGSADGKCYAPADDTIVRGNRFSDVEREIIFNDKLNWKPNPNCPPNDIPARGQIIEKSNTPADLSRAYLPSDPCIGPDW